MTKRLKGRPRIGRARSVVLTPEQEAWLLTKTGPGVSMAQVIRDVIEAARRRTLPVKRARERAVL